MHVLRGKGGVGVKQNLLNAFLAIFTALAVFRPDVAQAAGLNDGNTAWILTSTALVLFMTLPGLALF